MPRRKIEYTDTSDFDSVSVRVTVTAYNLTEPTNIESKVIRVEPKQR